MLTHAVSNFSKANNLLFVQGDAKSIPFKQQFDKIVCFYTLNWVIEQEQALQCFKDALKPGGSMLLILPGKSPSNLGPIVEKIVSSILFLKLLQYLSIRLNLIFSSIDSGNEL